LTPYDTLFARAVNGTRSPNAITRCPHGVGGTRLAMGRLRTLVEFEPGSSLFDLLHLQDELAELLAAPVDVVSAGGLRARDEHIRQEAILLA